MSHLSKLSTVVLSTAVLGLVIAGCQPQGEAPSATDEVAPTAETATADAMDTAAPAEVMTAAETIELFSGNTVLGVYDSWNMRWSEYFAPDGTARALVRIEGQSDLEVTGKYYANDRGQFCTEYQETEQKVFCHNTVPLGDGRYQQVYADGTMGAFYNQILEGEQLDALE
ncbi:MAG: hypothetical protein OXI75_10105 [Rhodospirillales bacterium]|nr:hypothetical protein [Rhodospirillales bacterium]